MNGIKDVSGLQVAVPAGGHVNVSVDVVNGGSEENVDVANGDEEEDAVREELEREVDLLMADKVYHDFVDCVVTHKEIVEDANDGDFEADEEVAIEEVGGGDVIAEGVAAAESDTSTSTLTDDEDYEDAQEEVKIPKQALMEADQRFPPFWRLKHAMKNELTAYKSDEDPDYDSEEDDDGSQDNEDAMKTVEFQEHRGGEAAGSDELIESSDDDQEDEAMMKAEVDELKAESARDLQPDVDGLVEMVEYMTLPPEASGVAVESIEDDEEQMEEEAGQAGQSILELDVDGYVSGEDPDFKPDPQLLERVDDETDSGSSSSSDDEDVVADAEQME